MLNKSMEELSASGAVNTAAEIRQQPEMWLETLEIYKSREADIEQFLNTVKQSAEGKIRVVFTGAGTSQYVGDTLVPYLNKKGDSRRYFFESTGSTSIVSVPEDYLNADDTTILVSFGRSGNSPESMAAVELTDKYVKNAYHIVVTCAEDGALARGAEGRNNALLLLTPEKTLDKGFAMTSSFTCMLLLTLLMFDETETKQKEQYINTAASMGHEVIAREDEIGSMLDKEYDRIVYLGSGSLAGLTREAQLKVLELTAGRMATVFDSSMGFRHGPKSFINEKTLLFLFVHNEPAVRRYDLDLLEEVEADGIAAGVTAIAQTVSAAKQFSGDSFIYKAEHLLPEAYLALPDVMVAQIVALLSSVKSGNTPDTPSPTGTVNRVVKGVIIYED